MIRIVTDSSCDIPADLIEKLGITIVPLTIRFGDEEFVDELLHLLLEDICRHHKVNN